MELHRIYASYGFEPEGFWRITPREMAARIDGAQRRLESEQDNRTWLAWHIAAFSRAQKLPELESLFKKQEKRPVQTPAELEINLDHLFLAMGGDPARLAEMRGQREVDDGGTSEDR